MNKLFTQDEVYSDGLEPLTCLLLLAGELPLQRSPSVQLHALTLLLRQGGSSRGGENRRGGRWSNRSRGRVDRPLEVTREDGSVKRIWIPEDVRFWSDLFA